MMIIDSKQRKEGKNEEEEEEMNYLLIDVVL